MQYRYLLFRQYIILEYRVSDIYTTLLRTYAAQD